MNPFDPPSKSDPIAVGVMIGMIVLYFLARIFNWFPGVVV